MNRIIFIETSDIGAKYTAEGCRRLGYEPLFLCNLKHIQGDTRSQLHAELLRGNVIDTSTQSVAQLKEALHREGINLKNVVGVTTFLDSRLEIAAQLAIEIGTAYRMDDAIIPLKSKSYVQKLIPEVSPPSLIFSIQDVPVRELNDLVSKYGKIIVKPTKTAGAIGTKIYEKENISQLVDELTSAEIPSFLQDEWIGQAFLAGPIYSAEGFVEQGEVQILGVSDRRKVGMTESQIRFPVEEQKLAELAKTSYQSAIELLVRRSNFKNGFFHIEFIEVGDECFVIDANMGRLGGGPLGEMIPMSYGLSISDFYAFVIQKSLNLNSKPIFEHSVFKSNNVRMPTVGTCYGSPVGGKFEKLKLHPQMPGFHTLILNEGQTIEAMGMNNWSWIGIASNYEECYQDDLSKIELMMNGRRVDLCY